ncbi:MAG: hypothetical protein H0U26_06440, partial [Acidimicrobiia bacterium]|nr:hypothetical protein [Acidimicrobiia bacterium]
LVAGVRGYEDRIEDFDRFDVEDSTGLVDLEEGDYSIYYEPEDDAVDLSLAYREPPIFAVVDEEGFVAGDVPVEGYDSDVTYDVDGRHGVGLYTFSVDEPDTYEISVLPSDVSSVPGEAGLVAVGPGVGRRFAGSLVAGIGLLGLGPLVGLVLAVATFVRRSRARRTVAPAW